MLNCTTRRSQLGLGLLVLILMAHLISCGGAEQPPEASAPAEPAESIDEETAAEEPALEEEAEEMQEEEEPAAEFDDQDIGAIGTEDDEGSPFEPGDGPKVTSTRIASSGGATNSANRYLLRLIDSNNQPLPEATIRLYADRISQTTKIVELQSRADGSATFYPLAYTDIDVGSRYIIQISVNGRIYQRTIPLSNRSRTWTFRLQTQSTTSP